MQVKYRRAIVLTQITPTLTHVEVAGDVNLGGSVPLKVNAAITVPLIANGPPEFIQFFVATRPADNFDDGDSTELGLLSSHMLYKHRNHEDTLRKEIIDHISLIGVFRTCQAKYRFLDEFLYHIMRNKTRVGAVQTSFNVISPCLLYTSPSPRDLSTSRMPSSA